MIEYLLFGTLLGLLLLGSMVSGIFIGYRLFRSAQNPKWFQTPVNTERTQALKERQNEDDYLKTFMDNYQKGLFMTAEDYRKTPKGTKGKVNV